MKHMPASRRQALAAAASSPTLTPNSARTSVAPERDEAALPPCLATGTPQAGDDNRRQGRDIIGICSVAARADDVDGVGGRFHPRSWRAHRLRRADQFLGRFARAGATPSETRRAAPASPPPQDQTKASRVVSRESFWPSASAGENGFELFTRPWLAAVASRSTLPLDQENCAGSCGRAAR